MVEQGKDQAGNQLEQEISKPFFYCRFVANYPKSAFGLTLCGHLLIVATTIALVLLGYDLFPTNFDSLPMHDWNVPWLRRDWAWTHRDNYTDRYVRKLYHQTIPNWFRVKEYARGNIVLYYDAGNKNIFTQTNLRKIEYIEKSITSMEQYSHYCVLILPSKCLRPASILRYFDGTFASVSPVFYDPNFTNIKGVLHEASINNETKDDFALFLAKHASISPNDTHASVTRTIIPLGYPLNADEDIRRMEKAMQEYLLESFKPLILKLKSETSQFELVYWSYLLFKADLAKQALKDAVLAIGSLLFIYFFIVYHTKSLWITSFGVMSIFTSFLAGNMIYRIVFDIRYIGFFHIIAIFIILGIGADDMFIFLDVWKNTAYKPYQTLAHRLSDTYKRAVLSMFVTSLTTVIAFFASSFSPLLPARSFGIFAGLLVIVNYISVVVFFPCVVITHHIYFKNCPWPCFRCCKSDHYCVNKERSHRSNLRTINAYSTGSIAGSYTCTNHSVWTVEGRVNNASETDKERTREQRHESDTDSFDSIPESERQQASHTDDVVESDTKSDADSVYRADRLCMETHDRKFLVRFFRDWYFRFLTNKVCRWLIVTGLLAMGIFFIFSALHLELDNEQVYLCIASVAAIEYHYLAITISIILQTRFYRSSHNYGKALEFDSYGFKKNFADRDVVVYIVWGLKHRDMSQCHFSDELCEGVQRYDNTFNPNTPEAQVALLNFCATLHSLSSKEIQDLHIRQNEQTNKPEIACFITDLQEFLQRETKSASVDWSLPWDYSKTMTFLRGKPLLYDTSRIDEDFPNLLEVPISYWLNDGYRFRNQTDFISYNSMIGEGLSPYSTPLKIDYSVFFGNNIKYIGVQVNLTLGRFSTGYKTGKPVMDKWENFVSSQMRKMPAGLKKGFQLTKTYWHSLSVQKTMADSAIFGSVLGIGCSLPILIVSTNNVIIAFFATLSLCCTAISVIGIIPLAGWKLGLIESLNMCMVVGLSVDYVVHLAEGYHRSAHAGRLSRVRDMLEEVGISVFSGACTTLGASVFMLFAEILFIIKFGIFMLCTIGFSLVFSLGFFTTVMGLVGPSGKTGNVTELYKNISLFFKKDKEKSSENDCNNAIETHF